VLVVFDVVVEIVVVVEAEDLRDGGEGMAFLIAAFRTWYEEFGEREVGRSRV